jgi:hypothetical protein
MTEEGPQAPDGDRLAGLNRPLRNRVTPAGELIATEHRGTMYGNRGVLHNENLALVRRYQVRRWLVCVLDFRGRRRPIMRPRRYTELFFLDEAVALAAGHRPCAECRHAAYQSFRTAWTAARTLPAKPGADDIDQVLHWQRRLVDGARVTYPALLSELPDGVFIVHDEEFWLANDGDLNRWTPAGYTDRIDQFDGPAAVLTPRATVEAIRAGYRPLVHLHALPERVVFSRADTAAYCGEESPIPGPARSAGWRLPRRTRPPSPRRGTQARRSWSSCATSECSRWRRASAARRTTPRRWPPCSVPTAGSERRLARSTFGIFLVVAQHPKPSVGAVTAPARLAPKSPRLGQPCGPSHAIRLRRTPGPATTHPGLAPTRNGED